MTVVPLHHATLFSVIVVHYQCFVTSSLFLCEIMTVELCLRRLIIMPLWLKGVNCGLQPLCSHCTTWFTASLVLPTITQHYISDKPDQWTIYRQWKTAYLQYNPSLDFDCWWASIKLDAPVEIWAGLQTPLPGRLGASIYAWLCLL